MAYDALLSLSQTVDRILIREEYPLPFEKETLVTLNRKVSALLTFLEDYSHKCRGIGNPLDSQIIDAAHHAEDIIEFRFSYHGLSEFCMADLLEFCISICWSELERNSASLQKALKKIDLIMENVLKIKNNDPAENVPSFDFSGSPNLSACVSSDINTMVLEDDFMVIKERIYSDSRKLEVIPIVGMGGIGKSTLARKLYEDSIKQRHFDRSVWVVVSQDYSQQKLLSEIILSMGKPATGDLKQLVYQGLFGLRYLIVVDDLWSENAWDDLNLIIPKDAVRSRVLVTTRSYQVARYVGSSSNPPHEMQLLNEYKSWKLFEERVFGEGFSCPSELEQIGKKMTKCCWGLPLTIVVISGLLKVETTKKYWESTSKNISSLEPAIGHCSKVLSLSYNHLPLHLKSCFLYVTAFPDYEIRAKRLIRLWIAEGFVKPNGAKCLEKMAEMYLHDLVGRNLLMISRKTRCSDRIKAINLHDVLRDFANSTAQKERFLYHHDLRSEYRRVATYDTSSLRLLSNYRKPATRSVLIPYYIQGRHSLGNLRLLRVLEAWQICMEGGSSKLVNLRYLRIQSIDCNFLKSNPELPNIQTLIIHNYEMKRFIIPLKIWKAPSLRHLILSPEICLEQPSEDDIIEETALQTMTVSNLRLTKKVLEMLLNLRKLRVHYKRVGAGESSNVHYYDLINLEHLQKLEKLTINFLGITSCFSDLAFPKSLQKLSIGYIHGQWKDLSAVGLLPNLEMFALRGYQTVRGGWEPIEGQFLKLKHLKLVSVELDHWEAESFHFHCLKTLFLKDVRLLNKIPRDIGQIDSLTVIMLAGCDKSLVDSAKHIQADQWAMGNEDFLLRVSTSRYSEDPKYKEIRPDKH